MLFKVKRIKQDGELGHALICPEHIVNVVPHKSIQDASVIRFTNGAMMVIEGSLDTIQYATNQARFRNALAARGEVLSIEEDGQS